MSYDPFTSRDHLIRGAVPGNEQCAAAILIQNKSDCFIFITKERKRDVKHFGSIPAGV